MSRQANKTLIGAFVVGGIALAVIAVTLFGSGALLTKRPMAVMYFDGSVTGLQEGAPVVFRGVKIGTVYSIKMVFEPEDIAVRIPVVVEFEPNRIYTTNGGFHFANTGDQVHKLIEKGLRARLGIISIVTGQLMIELDFFPEEAIHLVGKNKKYPEIPTIPSTIQKLSKTLDKLPIDQLVASITSAVNTFEKYINSPEMDANMKEVSGSLKQLHALLTKLSDKADPIADGVEGALSDTRGLIQGLDDRLVELTAELKSVARDTRQLVTEARAEIKPLSASIQQAAKAGANMMNQGEKTLSGIDRMVTSDSLLGHDLNDALREFSAAARAVRVLAEYLERHPEALVKGKTGL